MIRAIESALAGYAERTRDIARFAHRIADPDGAGASDMVGLMVSQRGAESSLVAARVADQTTDALLHIIA